MTSWFPAHSTPCGNLFDTPQLFDCQELKMIIRSRTIMRTKKEREKRKDSVAFCRSSGSLFSVRSEASRSLVLERVSCMVFSLSIMHGTAPRCSRTTYEVRVVQSYQVLLWTTARAILFIECSTEYALTADLLFIYPCLRCTKKKKKGVDAIGSCR